MPESGVVQDANGTARCWWCGTDPLYVAYHDQEWGRTVHDDVRLFEKICLEGFQAGLSWLTILRKRESFREAFAGFDLADVAKFSKRRVNELMKNQAIVRHQGKIESTINNAKQALRAQQEFGSLDAFFWSYQPVQLHPPSDKSTIPVKTPVSIQLSKDLKKRGWTFVGPTTCYAFMQAVGMVNDHLLGCVTGEELRSKE